MVKKKSTTNEKAIEICYEKIVGAGNKLTLLRGIRDIVEKSVKETKYESNKEIFRTYIKYIDYGIDGHKLALGSLVELLNEIDPVFRKKYRKLGKIFKNRV